MDFTENDQQLSKVLLGYLKVTGFTLGQVSRLTDIPKATLVNWLTGRVKRPRCLDDLLKIARALHLDSAEASHLLKSAGYPGVSDLLQRVDTKERQDILSVWAQSDPRHSDYTPFQAIPDLPYFIGREAILKALEEAILGSRHPSVHFLHGMAGVGKTTLAARLAYRLRPYFPDGVLWARLDTSDTMTILSTFARAYERDVSGYTDLESRSRVVRELLADKRTLIVLDNAIKSEQIRPLLPPTGCCSVLVTTVRHDLWEASGASRFDIGLFSIKDGESLALFKEMLGEDRLQDEQAIYLEIADLVGHHPLAVAIAASRLAYEPFWSAADFVEQVRQDKKRLDALAFDDRSVRLSLTCSFDSLSPDLQEIFTELGVFGDVEFTAKATSFVTERPMLLVEESLRKLYCLSLIQSSQQGLYRLHPLVRDYLIEMIPTSKPFGRMVSYYRKYFVEHAMDFHALDQIVGNVQVALKVAYNQEMAEDLLQLSLAFHEYLEFRGLLDLDRIYLNLAKEAAFRLGDQPGLMAVIRNLGRVERLSGNLDQAARVLSEGLRMDFANEPTEDLALLFAEAGIVALLQGDYAGADELLSQGLTEAQLSKNIQCLGVLLNYLGILSIKRGHFERAKEYFSEGLFLARKLGDNTDISTHLTNLGLVLLQLGEDEQGESHLREALGLAEQTGHLRRISLLKINLGEVVLQRGRLEEAERYLEEAIGNLQSLEDEPMVLVAQNTFAELRLRQGCLEEAASIYLDSFMKARQADCKESMGEAQFGMARVLKEQGKLPEAERFARDSLSFFQALGHYKAAEVSRWLDGLEVILSSGLVG